VPTWPTNSLTSGFVYVRETEPENPEEGETWYDLNGNEAKVYDGGVWHLLTVTEHSEIGGVSAGQHRSDANIRSTVDGQVDAETVDGKHASDLGASVGVGSFTGSESNSTDVYTSGQTYSFTVDAPCNFLPYDSFDWSVGKGTSSSGYSWSVDWTVTVYYDTGGSTSFSGTDGGSGTVNIPRRRISHLKWSTSTPDKSDHAGYSMSLTVNGSRVYATGE